MIDTEFERFLEEWQQRNTTRPCEAAEEHTMEHKQGFDSWALVELMGHQRIAGRVTEAEIGGSKFVRVDVPEAEGTQALTKFYGPSAIYAITPLSEETARLTSLKIDAAPISYWDAERLVTLAKEIDTKQRALVASTQLGGFLPGEEESEDDVDAMA